MSSRGNWVVLDCGDRLEIVHVACSGTRSIQPILKTDLLEAKWDSVNQSYIMSRWLQPLSLEGIPSHVRDDLERFRLGTDQIEETEKDLRYQLRKFKRLDLYDSLYFLGMLAALIILTLYISSRSFFNAGIGGLILLCLLVMNSRNSKKRAVRRLKREERLFLKLTEATHSLERFIASDGKNTGFFDDSISCLDVRALMPRRLTGWRVADNGIEQMKELIVNVSYRVPLYAKKLKDNLPQLDRLIIQRLNILLPLLIKPDLSLIESWNNSVTKELPAPAITKPSMYTEVSLAVSSRPRLVQIARLVIAVLVGYVVTGAIFFVASMIQSQEFAAYLLSDNNPLTFLLAGPGLASLWPLYNAFGQRKEEKK